MAALTIGNIRIQEAGLLLAPMEDVTDRPFRMICKEQGADIVYTEFVNAEGLIRERERGSQKTQDKLDFGEAERPLGIQIYGASELSMEAATQIATAARPDLIDINCGCWVSNVALRGAGAGLLRDPDRMRLVAERVIGATGLPVTVKTRLGWDADSIRIVEVATMLQEIGVKALSVHCRTRAQGHKGEVDYSWIARLVEAVSIPVIANGDINTATDVHHVLSTTGCDGVMLGRGAIRHPWVFREARHLLRTGEAHPPPTMTERGRVVPAPSAPRRAIQRGAHCPVDDETPLRRLLPRPAGRFGFAGRAGRCAQGGGFACTPDPATRFHY